MKLLDSEIEIEAFGVKEEHLFSIEDNGMVFDILRKKMYSNAVAAICREISCNARDAHREIGKSDVPVMISIPTRFDPHYRVRDNGPGITPNRMINVFIKYAASTKRSDNMQTGGFGLGAKTPFAYANTFNIVSVTDGVKRTYTALIDETRVGKLLLVNEIPTDEGNGTEIVIPIKQADFEEFRKWTYESTKHWAVKPTIFGAGIDYPDFATSTIMSGSNWFLSRADTGYYGGRQMKVLVDGIEYPFDVSVLNDPSFSNLFGGNYVLYMNFEVGALSVAANRELLDIDDRTKLEISSVLCKVRKEIKASAQKKIDATVTYRGANDVFHEICQSIGDGYRQEFNWCGLKLFGQAANVNSAIFQDFSVEGVANPEGPSAASRAGRRRYGREHQNLNLTKGSRLVINDLPDMNVSEKHVTQAIRGMFDALNPKDFGNVQLARIKDMAAAEIEFHLSKLDYRLLSEFVKPRKVSARSYLGRMTFYRFENGKFARSSLSVYENDTQTKVCVTLWREGRGSGVFSKNAMGNRLDSHSLGRLISDTDISVYGFINDVNVDKLAATVVGLVTLEDYMKDYMKSFQLDAAEAMEIANYTENIGAIRIGGRLGETKIREAVEFIAKKENAILQYFAECDRMMALQTKYEKMRYFSNIIAQNVTTPVVSTKCTLVEMAEKITTRYPLIENLGYGTQVEHVAEYINLIDSVR